MARHKLSAAYSQFSVAPEELTRMGKGWFDFGDQKVARTNAVEIEYKAKQEAGRSARCRRYCLASSMSAWLPPLGILSTDEVRDYVLPVIEGGRQRIAGEAGRNCEQVEKPPVHSAVSRSSSALRPLLSVPALKARGAASRSEV